MVYWEVKKIYNKSELNKKKNPTYPFCGAFNSNCIENFIHNYRYIILYVKCKVLLPAERTCTS